MTATDVRYGRRGGRWAASPQTAADVAKLDEWRRQRDALAAAAARAGEQLTLDHALEEDPC